MVRKELARLEKAIARLDAQEKSLHAQLAEHATNYERAAELNDQLRRLHAERHEAEERWLELAE